MCLGYTNGLPQTDPQPPKFLYVGAGRHVNFVKQLCNYSARPYPFYMQLIDDA